MAGAREPAEVRRRRIVELAGAGEFIRPAEIAKSLSVSGETIRRDLLILEESGRLRRMHGGAVAESVRSAEPDRSSRTQLHQVEKGQIAAIVASLVGPRDAIFLDVGTTVEAAARALPAAFRGTVITNSLIVGTLLGDRGGIDLHVLGGKIRVGEYTSYGEDTLTQLAGYHTDFAFIGAGGIHPQVGLTDYSSEDVSIKRLMIANAATSYVLATNDKVSHIALRHVCGLDHLDGVITDSGVTQEKLASFSDTDLEILHP